MTTELATVEATVIDKMAPEQFFISKCLGDRDLWAEAAKRLQVVINTGLLPAHIDTPAKAMVAIEYGADLGMTPLESMRSMHVVMGNPTLKAGAIGALILKRFGPDAFRVVRQGDEGCVIRVKQLTEAGEVEYHDVEFLEKHAKAAGLINGQMWKKYPADMYYARAISRVQKRFFQHLGSGEVWIAELVQKDSRPAPRSLGDL